MLTGSAPTAAITVESGTPTLSLNQNAPGDVWTITGMGAVLEIQTVNGMVRFGAEGAYEAVQGVLTADKLKLNPEAGASITISATGDVTQGEFTISGLGSRTLAVYGANLDGGTFITNNSDTAVSVDVNDTVTELASSGGSSTIPKADAIFNGGPEVEVNGEKVGDDNVRGYIYDNGTKLVYAGEGTATVAESSVWSDELLPYRETVTQVAFDPDISTIGSYVIYQLSGIERLEIKYATSVNRLYNARMKELWLGSQVTSYITGNYSYNLETITVQDGNTALMLDDGVLYTADGGTMIICPAGRTESELAIPEGVTGTADMAIWQAANLTSITLPASLESVDVHFLVNTPIEEMTINGMLNTANTGYDNGSGAKFFNSQGLRSLTVPEGYDFAGSNLFTNTSLNWVTGITVTGGEDVTYDGGAHGVTVTGPTGATVEYSADGVTYSADAVHAYTNPSTYTVYWQVTYNGGTVYSQASFTITALEASEDWFTLTTVKTDGVENPVTLNQPAAAPTLKNGYTVYYAAEGGTPTEDVPTETGDYLVTVAITAEGYVNETLTLGYYTVPAGGQVVLSFLTYGGSAIEPITGSANSSIEEGS